MSGLHYGAWYGEWETDPTWRALSPSAQAVYRSLWSASCGFRSVAIPASRGAELVGIWPRTWRRAIGRLVEAGLVDRTPGGGAHACPNVYLARAIGPLRHHKKGPQPAVREAAGDVLVLDAGEELAALLRPAGGPDVAVEPATVADLPAELVDAVVTEHAAELDGVLDAEQVRAQVLASTPSTVLELAARYGVAAPAARVVPVDPAVVPLLAQRMVQDYLGRQGVTRRPRRYELDQAHAVVEHSGTACWERYEAAVKRQADAIRFWRKKPAIRVFGYLWMHLVGVGAAKPAPALDPPPDAPPEA